MDKRATRIAARGTGMNSPAPAVVALTIKQVSVSVVDALILQVPEVEADNISGIFKTKSFTTIEGEPTYSKMDEIRYELNCNAVAIKSPFGGGIYGHLGIIMKDVLYHTELGTSWTVPEFSGAYPVFPNDANENDKKRIVADFIKI